MFVLCIEPGYKFTCVYKYAEHRRRVVTQVMAQSCTSAHSVVGERASERATS